MLRLVAGPLVAVACGVLAWTAGLAGPAVSTAAVTGLTATWWVLEPIPIAAASLVPFAAFPLLGVLDHKAVAAAYGHTLIMLLMGGFMLSTAMAASGAHRRVAVTLVRALGGGRRRLVLGFMLATAFCSMWISNTATVLMLLPVALAVLEQDPRADELGVPLLLGIAWASSIGGLGTPVGTPPNVIFIGAYEEVTGVQIGFLDWMGIGLPAVAVLLPVAWWLMVRRLPPGQAVRVAPLGPMGRHESRVLLLFAITALAWTTRTAPWGGWSRWLHAEGAGDATVAFVALLLLFVLPSGEPARRGEQRTAGRRSVEGRLLSWEEARQIPWGLLLLFGGGIAIARAFDASGLGDAIGHALASFTALPVFALLLLLCLGVTFLTEVTSNTATTTLLMPVLASAATAGGRDPALLMVPAALSASCAFMLPVATAPNAIVFGTDRVPMPEMVRRGLALNVAGAVLLAGLCTALLRGGLV
ncbi:MAG: SLC13/DASS family transporter [Deltaproteobacteria bacterium]|nr:MAG: SLC13/DASS family transporter [Deltaproteobacteria bacterium]